MTFVSRQNVRFAHVDAAAIIFYPRYFEMLNAAVEDFFDEVVGVGFSSLHGERRLGVPTVRLDAEFLAPSRLGDLLDFELGLAKLGRSSLEFDVHVRCGKEERFRARQVIVCMDLDQARSVSWPNDIRSHLAAQQD
jgi:4-hydroxybenzoyl-CoA thioesterase